MSHYLLAVHTDSQPREMSEEDMRRRLRTGRSP